jgi:DNA primase catalytic subunit
MATDNHDKMIEAFQSYFKWQDRFEFHDSDEAGIKARFWLSEIRKFASDRRLEIQNKREERKAARKGMVGRPPKVSSSDDDTPMDLPE